MFKRIFTLLICFLLIAASSFSCLVFADSELPSGYESANTDTDLVQSFSDYVKSRNANFDGSLTDATNLYILNKMQKGADSLNTSLTNIKSKLAKKTSSGGNVIWYLDSTVTNFYNSLFDFLLRDLDLSVGDTANETVYSGDYFTDADGYSTLIYYVTNPTYYSSSGSYGFSASNLTVGTPYRYNSIQLYDNYNNGINSYTYHLTSSITYNLSINGLSQSNLVYMIYSGQSNNSRTFYRVKPATGSCYVWGVPAIVKNVSNDKYYFARIGCSSNNSDDNILGQFGDYPNNGCSFYPFKELTSDISGAVPAVIYFTTNNKTINNNNYEGDTYITNEGDIVDNTPSQPGGTDPGWNVGGGQGSYEDNNGNSYTINFPDFELPDLNIDWSIDGLGNKFPFSIPFDIAALVGVLNAEPEAPRFQGTVDFGFTTWNYDINLQQFDSVAQVCRIAELLLLVFGLILITRSLIKG